MQSLTAEQAQLIESVGKAAGLHTCCVRSGRAAASEAARGEFERFSAELETWLPGPTAADVKWLAWNAAWHAANNHTGHKFDQFRDKQRFNGCAARLREGGVLSVRLAINIKWMLWNLSWYSANTQIRPMDDQNAANAEVDLVRATAHKRRLLDSTDEECVICLELTSYPTVLFLDCGHAAIHPLCFDQFRRGTDQLLCPVCRTDLTAAAYI